MLALGWSVRAPSSRRSQVAVLVAVFGVVGFLVVGSGRPSATSEARARAALLALSTVVTGLPAHQNVVTSHPSCDAYPPCASASITWPLPAGSLTLVGLDRALPSWVSRNHLDGPVQWRCGPRFALFGSEGNGCQTSFDGPASNQAVYLATTFTDQSALSFDPATTPYVFMPDPLATLGNRTLASLSIQVVRSNH